MNFAAGPKPTLHGLTSWAELSLGKCKTSFNFHGVGWSCTPQLWMWTSSSPGLLILTCQHSFQSSATSLWEALDTEEGKLWCLCTCLSFSAASSLWRSLGSANFSKCPSWNLLQGGTERLLWTGENGSFEEKDNAKLISVASGFSGYGHIKMYLNTGIKWELLAPSAVVQWIISEMASDFCNNRFLASNRTLKRTTLSLWGDHKWELTPRYGRLQNHQR